jgi:hypothetical protein
MTSKLRSSLIAAGAEALADALLELASRHDDAAQMVQRMLASPEENMARFREGFTDLLTEEGSGRFFEWNESEIYANMLSDLLRDLEAAQPEPCAGLDEVAAFYRSFESTMNICHDAYHHVASVFERDAAEHFAMYARRCDDKVRVADMVFQVSLDDAYGVTDHLVGRAPQFLGEEEITRLISRFRETVESEAQPEARWRSLQPLEKLASSTHDPELLVWCRRIESPDLGTRDLIDIGRAFLDAGDAEAALEWLRDAKADGGSHDWELEGLVMEALRRVGDVEPATEIAQRRFDLSRSEHTLRDLLELIGEGERERVVNEASKAIGAEAGYSMTDLLFLVAQGRLEAADVYVVQRAEHLDGSFWHLLAPVAEALDDAGRALAASLVCRALLDSILERGSTKAYDHGARYMANLQRLESTVDDWSGRPTHEQYVAGLRRAHGRKWSFWQRVEE